MTFGAAIKTCLQKYLTLRGRARRAEFWWFYLFTLLVALAAGFMDALLFGSFEDSGPLETISSLALLIPTITATVRRLHDTGRPGYYIFVPILAALVGGGLMFMLPSNGGLIIGGLILVAGIVMQIVWLVQQSQPGMNQYGPNPIEHPNGENLVEVFE